jgi:hypothetical protein
MFRSVVAAAARIVFAHSLVVLHSGWDLSRENHPVFNGLLSLHVALKSGLPVLDSQNMANCELLVRLELECSPTWSHLRVFRSKLRLDAIANYQ